MAEPSDVPRIRFGAFELDEESGELCRDGSDPRAVVRLPPQAAKLLSHLIERRPNVVSRAEIRRLLWPDTTVDFDQSLHACIRKIRASLGDSASNPEFVETIPRRGYRFIGPVVPEEDAVASLPVSPLGTGSRRRAPYLAMAAGLGLAAVLVAASLRFGGGPPSPTRIAVMPFEPTRETSVLPRGNDIAESIVNLLTNRHASAVEVIGPSTTRAYEGRPHGLRELLEDLDVDYVVNARESTGASGERLLVEIIRARDGAHVWVRYLDEMPAGKEPAETIADAVAEGCSLFSR